MTINKGNWIKDVQITKDEISEKTKEQYQIYNRIIDKYIIVTPKEINDKNSTSSLNTPSIKLDFPEYAFHYDIFISKKYSKKIQSWRGLVTFSNNEMFAGRLHDLTNKGTDEYVEIEMQDVSPEDRKLVMEGAVFYLSVGYYMENGQITKQSEIRFQRLIPLNDEEFELAMQNVDMKFKKLKKRVLDNYTT